MVRRVLVAVLVLAGALAAVSSAAPPGGADGNEAPGAPAAFRSITAGGAHACAIVTAGRLKCWGNNPEGQLGQGDRVNRGDGPGEMGADLPAIDLGVGRTATAVTAGSQHVCALLDNGTVKCWGDGNNGATGYGDTFDRGVVAGQLGVGLGPVDLGTGRTATAISAGANHTCALLDNSTVKCWGNNDNGQLGLGDSSTRGDGPGEMGDNLPAVSLGTGRTATAISAGFTHTCALLDNATVKCWGQGTDGRLGLGNITNRGDSTSPGHQMGDNLPTVSLGTGRTAVAVSAGFSHTCALLDNATVKCWGANQFGQLGLGDTTPRGDAGGEMGDSLPAVSLGTGRTVTAISAGAGYDCARLDNATVKCWGSNSSGQLGLGDTVNRGVAAVEMGDNLPAVQLGAGHTATAVTTGDSFACVRLDDATLKCWGQGASGQLGQAGTANRGDGAGEMGDNLPTVPLEGTGIEGTVESTTGPFLPGVLVAVLRPGDFSIAGGGSANGNGDFSIAVPAGQYFVYVVDRTGGFQPAFLGGPTTVTVTANQMTVANPTMAPTTGSIVGTVTQTGNGAPVSGAWVLALNATTGAPETGVVADGSGQFTLAGLRPGNHLVAYLDPAGGHGTRFHPSATTTAAATPVAVTAAGTATANGSLPAQTVTGTGAAITGRVGEPGSSSGLPGVLVLALRAGDLTMARGAVTNATGNYMLNVASGDYKLAFLDPTGRHAMEWHDDLPSSGIAGATSVTAPASVNATLDQTIGAISGTVRNALNQPLTNAWAIAIGPTGVAGAAVTTTGSYTISNIPVGTYRLALVYPPTGAFEYWQDAPDYAGATVFVVTAGDTTGIDATIGGP